ncbi:hypothetical protein B0A49_05115 [Cryomyces minteri]|uniref:Uncharacterized protein n=1 Tax=Cryomyces minteri TaxID=331657 RepID=A0A4U0X2A4_9PEZI|nr:hypothetical protein B0A49_05115 [Cryomyces minteri]
MSDTMNQADEQTNAVTKEYESASSQISVENNASHEKTKQMATAEIPSILVNKSRTSVVARTQHLLTNHKRKQEATEEYEDVTSRRLPLVDLVDKGLFRIYPEFEIFDKSRKSTGLYERCVALRRALFPELKEGMRGPELIPLEHLDWAVKIARCFVKNETPEQEVKAPLILVLKILSLRRRPSRSRLLVDWIREHYNRQDLEDIIHPDMTRVADNLPENLQYLDLVRDSRYALDVPMIPDNIVERGCTIHSIRGFKYKADDLRHMPRPRLCVPRGYSEIADMNPSKRRRVDTLSEEPTATTTQSPIASSDSAPGTDHSHRDAENLTDSVGASNPLTDLEDSSTALVEATEVLSQPHDAPSGSELPKTPSVQVDDLPALTFDQPATSTDVLTQFARHQPSLPSNSRVHLLAWR